MKKWTKILIGVAMVIVVMWVFSFITGLLFWGLVAAALGAAVFLAVRKLIKKDEKHKDPEGLLNPPAENDIDRVIKEMERMAGDA